MNHFRVAIFNRSLNNLPVTEELNDDDNSNNVRQGMICFKPHYLLRQISNNEKNKENWEIFNKIGKLFMKT